MDNLFEQIEYAIFNKDYTITFVRNKEWEGIEARIKAGDSLRYIGVFDSFQEAIEYAAENYGFDEKEEDANNGME